VNRKAPIVRVSCKTGEGLERWLELLLARVPRPALAGR